MFNRKEMNNKTKTKNTEKISNLWIESEGNAVMVAVLESLVEDEPLHSSTITSDVDDDTSMADCFSVSVD